MAHRAHTDFWFHYRRLPSEIKDLADKCFRLLEHDPRHPSLRLKKIGDNWTARISRDYRVIAVEVDGGLMWVWIGSHDDYDRFLKQ